MMFAGEDDTLPFGSIKRQRSDGGQRDATISGGEILSSTVDSLFSGSDGCQRSVFDDGQRDPTMSDGEAYPLSFGSTHHQRSDGGQRHPVISGGGVLSSTVAGSTDDQPNPLPLVPSPRVLVEK